MCACPGGCVPCVGVSVSVGVCVLNVCVCLMRACVRARACVRVCISVDAQSFATCSEKFPALCKQGGYPNTYSSPSAGQFSNATKTKKLAVYTPAELADIVSYAKGYGVRIQPEWDMPGASLLCVLELQYMPPSAGMWARHTFTV